MSKINTLIEDFSTSNLISFLRDSIKSFKPKDADLDHLFPDDIFEKYESITKVGDAVIAKDDLIVITSKTTDPLTERSGKKKQYEIAKKILKEELKDAALFVFYDDDGNFRFSFVKANYLGTKRDFTTFKRYSYFVTTDQTNKTFIRQIGNCNFNSLDEIIEAFSVEPLNKLFYQEIAKAFYSLIGGKVKIGSRDEEFNKVIILPSQSDDDKTRKTQQEFAVRLIGRTIFCWFLKNKKSDAGISLIPEDWLSSKAVKTNYYHSILEKLFFLVLNKKTNDRKTAYLLPDNHTQIPFLNGGLFEPHPEDSFDNNQANYGLKIPDEWFKTLFDTLEQYNFTIDENSIYDAEVSIDPEMLGTIFENLLAEIDPDTEKSARKSTGSFYTPREIVDYMVEQSLIQYLKTKTSISEEDALIDLFKEGGENKFNPFETKTILQALSDVKILDPACGSGAFPMGALHKIINALHKLDPDASWWKARQIQNVPNALAQKMLKEKLDSSSADYVRKLGIIQNSIYGVDIQPIAAEISKLRSFLSLVIDENIDDKAENRGIEPLPNLEFKFVTANTLIGLEEKNISVMDFGQTDDLQDQLKEIRNRYLQAYGNEKNILKKEFKSVQTQIYKNELAGGGQNKRALQLASWEPFGNEPNEWFDPYWMYGIKQFDIVMGNPPYGVSVKGEYRKDVLNHLDKVPDFEIYYFFLEVSKKFIGKNGITTYIIPNTFLFNVYATNYREQLLIDWSCFIIDCTSFKIFDKATVLNAIVILQNQPSKKLKYFKTANINKFRTLINQNICDIKNEELLSFNQNWGLVFKLDSSILKLAKKLKSIPTFLNLYYDVSQGYIPYRKSDLIKKYGKKEGEEIVKSRKWHSDFKINSEYKQEIQGRNITKFSYERSDSFVWYGKHLAGFVDLKYFNQTRVLVREITSPTIIASIVNEELVNDPQLISIIPKSKNSYPLTIIWAILNSKLATFFHFNASPKATKGAFPKILVDDIKKFPVPILSNIIIQKIDKLVRNLETMFRTNNLINLSDLENTLDIIIYKIYFLTYDEVIIIEPEFSLTRHEYDNYSID
ncbi:Eco57I restriction-modification methylase domain-containing protein [Yeosuana sp. AK3]